MEVVYPRCAGIDVGKKTAAVCIRVQGHGSIATSFTTTSRSTTMPSLLRLRRELVTAKVQRVVLESTSDYWRPVFYVLCEQLDVILVRASDVKAIPGRKTDVKDAEWLADLAAHGLVRASFVPPEQQRHLRDLTRARSKLLADRTRDAQRLEKELEDACIKLSAVATDLQGVSARLMLDQLIAHNTDPAAMAELAKGRMRTKLDQLTEALTGRFDDHHAFMVRFWLDRLDAATTDLDRLDTRIEELITDDPDFHQARELLSTIPGLGRHGTEELLAEIGPDMTVFDTAQQLASWAGTVPAAASSAGKHKSTRVSHGNRYLKRTLGIAAKSVARTKAGFLPARFRRLAARHGYNKALVATEHAMLTAAWHILTTQTPYHDLGSDHYQRRPNKRAIQHHITELEAAGYTITKAA